MNILKDKQYKSYPSLSRYTPFPFYYNQLDNKYMYGLTSQLSNTSKYIVHNVEPYDTPDSLSLAYYGRPDYFWIILDFNKIQNPYIELYKNYDKILIPSISEITFTKRV